MREPDHTIEGRWRVVGELDYSGPPRRETWADFWIWIAKIVFVLWSFGVTLGIAAVMRAVVNSLWPH